MSKQGSDARVPARSARVDPLAEHAYSAIRGRIVQKLLKPGDALVEAKLAEELGMSRTPVRDALVRLRHEGLVATIPNKGSFVESLSPIDIAEIYDVREVLEGLAARLLAWRITAEQAETLAEVADRADDPRATVSDVEAFHSALLTMCGNRRVAEAARSLRLDIITYDEQTRRLTSNGTAPIAEDGRIVGIHRALADKIISRHPKAAEEEARLHVRMARRNAAKFLLGIEGAI